MAARLQHFAKAYRRLPLLFLLSIAAVVLIHIGFGRLGHWRDTFATDPGNLQMWRFYLAGLILSLGGLVAGLAIRNQAPKGNFNWLRALAFGIVPLLLAMSLPMFISRWPLSTMSSPLWEFRAQFSKDSYVGAAWILVGLAVASGFGAERRK